MNPNNQFNNFPGQDNNNPQSPVSDFSPAQPRPALDANDPDISSPAYRPQVTPQGTPLVDPFAPVRPVAPPPLQQPVQPQQVQSSQPPQPQPAYGPSAPSMAQQPQAPSPPVQSKPPVSSASVGIGPMSQPPIIPLSATPAAASSQPAAAPSVPSQPQYPVQQPASSSVYQTQPPQQSPQPAARPFEERPLPPLHDEPEPPVVQPSPASKLGTFFGGTAKTVVGGVLFLALVFGGAALLNAFVFQSYYVDGQSMEPTLQNDDRLIISKVGVTGAKLSGNQYVPERGDIVVLDETSTSFTASQNEQLIKRVIGLPGERVKVEAGKVTVINDENPKGFDPAQTLGLDLSATFTDQPLDVRIPADSVYVMGDNRAEGGSYDSRSFGPVGTEHIVGNLWLRVLPLNQLKVF